MTDTKIILASGSPRRAEILRNIGLDFEVRPTGADETLDAELSPTQMVCELAFRKAEGTFPLRKKTRLSLPPTPLWFTTAGFWENRLTSRTPIGC